MKTLTFTLSLALTTLPLAYSQAAPKPAQTSSGPCSPNFSNVTGQTTLVFLGNCQNLNLDPDAIKQLNAFLKRYPEQNEYLLDDLKRTKVDLKTAVSEAAANAAKFDALQKKLEAMRRAKHIADDVKMNDISDDDRKAMSGLAKDFSDLMDHTSFQLKPEFLVELGWFYAATAQPDEALNLFLLATKQNPSLGSAYAGLAYVTQLQGNELLRKQDVDKAAELLDKSEGYAKIARQYDEADTSTLVQLGYTEKDLAGAYSAKGAEDKAKKARESASKLFQMVIGVNPQDPGALNGLGNIYYEQGDFDNAIKETQLATSFAPTYTFAWYDLVIALQQKYVHGGQSRNEAAQTLLSLITALDKLNDLGQNPNAQKLPPAASQQMSDLVTWATAEANKYKQDSPEK